jgi:SAM-dependent methyltransferase
VDSVRQTRAFYAPLFTRFKEDLTDRSLDFETRCLAFELRQIPDVPQSGVVLDAGCGTGRYSAAWRNLFPAAAVVGVDINDIILKSGQVKAGALTPINGNLEALPFRSGSFDVVMSRGVIMITRNPRRALEELVRVCKPGGLLYFYSYKHGWYDVVLAGFRKIAGLLGFRFCSRVIYGICRLFRLDPRVSTMILDELFVPIRFALREADVLEWLQATGIPRAAIKPVVHAQFSGIPLPVDRRTAWLHRVLPKNGLITLAAWKPQQAS